VVGFLGALVPEKQVATLMGDNSFLANLFASVVGCLFYFATLTEVPILEALMKNGMASGPALALLLAGPALSLPSILVIRKVIGDTKTAVFVGLVIVMATVAGMGFGTLYPAHNMTTTTTNVAAIDSQRAESGLNAEFGLRNGINSEIAFLHPNPTGAKP